MKTISILPTCNVEKHLHSNPGNVFLLFNTSIKPANQQQIPVTFSFFDMFNFDDVRSFLFHQITGLYGSKIAEWECAALDFIDELVSEAKSAAGYGSQLSFKDALNSIGFKSLSSEDIIDFSFSGPSSCRLPKTYSLLGVKSKSEAKKKENIERIQYITMQISSIWEIHELRYNSKKNKLLMECLDSYIDMDGERKPFDEIIFENDKGNSTSLVNEVHFIVGKLSNVL